MVIFIHFKQTFSHFVLWFSHRWFKAINWKDVEDKKYTAPIQPIIKSPNDTGNFDFYDEEAKASEEANESELTLFKDF